MAKVRTLAPEKLRVTCNPARVSWSDSTQAPRAGKKPDLYFQDKAVAALEFALRVSTPGYHVYLSGEPGQRRTAQLTRWLRPRVSSLPAPPDLLYLPNFRDPAAPLLLIAPPGFGARFIKELHSALSRLSGGLRKEFSTRLLTGSHDHLLAQNQSRKIELLAAIRKQAHTLGLRIEFDDSGGILLEPDKLAGKLLPNDLQGLLQNIRALRDSEDALREEEEKLTGEALKQAVGAALQPFASEMLKALPDNPALQKFLIELCDELAGDAPERLASPSLARDSKYTVRLFVDNSRTIGAPVVVEAAVDHASLFGFVERDGEAGPEAAVLAPGALQRANGGFLVLHAEDLIRRPSLWDRLLKILLAREIRPEDSPENDGGPTHAHSLRPAPIHLNVKVILIGDESLYEDLLSQDERFASLFRIKAHLSQDVARTTKSEKLYLTQLAQMAQEAGLKAFDSGALARLLDWGSRLCEDQGRLSLSFSDMLDAMVEADSLVTGHGSIDAATVDMALANRQERMSLLETRILEDYGKKVIRVATRGETVGQVNGMALTWYGGHEFGLPQRISCTVGTGHEGIIDLEREADLGGPIHTKAMMILKSFLTAQFARKRPLVLSASIYFQQSYAEIEGDSASGAELMALLSALSEIPVRQDLAFTGSVNHTGEILAVGGVTKKIEGFYKVCRQDGLTGTQGVLIPADNVCNLMLSEDVIRSVMAGEFAIYPVQNMDEAIWLLTGCKAGKRRKDGSFTPGSFYDQVDRRLENLGAYAQNSFRKRKE